MKNVIIFLLFFSIVSYSLEEISYEDNSVHEKNSLKNFNSFLITQENYSRANFKNYIKKKNFITKIRKLQSGENDDDIIKITNNNPYYNFDNNPFNIYIYNSNNHKYSNNSNNHKYSNNGNNHKFT